MDDPYTKVTLRPYGGGFLGCVDMPMSSLPGRVKAIALGDSRVDALTNAALVAERIANDPVMQALMPPQAIAAIAAAKGLASAAHQGSDVLKSFWGKLHGPGKKRLAKVLHREALEREREEEESGALQKRDHRNSGFEPGYTTAKGNTPRSGKGNETDFAQRDVPAPTRARDVKAGTRDTRETTFAQQREEQANAQEQAYTPPNWGSLKSYGGGGGGVILDSDDDDDADDMNQARAMADDAKRAEQILEDES